MLEIIAHRGSSYQAPENTLAAVRLAWAEGADAVEADFRLTADDRIVALHDATLRRTAGVDWKVVDYALDELSTLDVGAWKHPFYTGEQIPTLKQMLAILPAGKRFFVELKTDGKIVQELARVVEASPRPSQVVPIGFSLNLMRQVKQALPMCSVFGVFEFETNPATGAVRPTAEEIVLRARDAGLDGVDLDATGPLDAEFVSELRRAELQIAVWTVDDPVRARELLAVGIESITTNRPGWLRQELAS